MKNAYIMRLMAVLMALVWFSPQSKSAVTLDQSQEIFQTTSVRVSSARSLSQTFTVGISGYLSKVSLLMDDRVGNTQFVTLGIYETDLVGGVYTPNSTKLWTSGAISLGSGWSSVDLTSGAPTVSIGNVYSLVLTSTNSVTSSNNNWYVTTGDNYAGGQMFGKTVAGWVPLVVSGTPIPDATFKTYVSPIPEPSTVTFFGCFSILVFFRRIRR